MAPVICNELIKDRLM